MNPRTITNRDVEHWSERSTVTPLLVTYAADDSTFVPCPAIVTVEPDEHGVVGEQVVRVAWQLDEIEMMHLVNGGTLWLSTWGGLPPHALEVQPPMGAAS